MLGPRTMDAGTNVAPPLAGASSFDARYPPPLTPAQRLIERYERLNTPPPHTPPPHPAVSREKSTLKTQYVYDYRDHSSDRAAESLATPDSVRDSGLKDGRIHAFGAKKDKSPIRQSLRNLFSVIKKGVAKRRSEDRLGSPTGAAPPGASVATKLSPSSSPDEGNAVKANPVSATARPQKKRITGPLFYLTREAPTILSSPCQLIWTSCSVTLDIEARKLLVTSFTGTDIELCIHEILLSQCTDIRSLVATQLGSEERAALDEVVGPEKETLRVFEVLFEGGEREKFAARSVKERAGWISAIWDAILPEQELKRSSGSLNQASSIAQPKDDRPHKILKVESPRPTPLPHLSSLLMQNPSLSDRSLPPLPPKSPLPPVHPLTIAAKNKQNLHLDLSEFEGPISPSIYPPTSMAGSSAGTEVPIDTDGISKTDSERPKHLRLDTTSTNATGEDGERVISPSVYIGTSMSSSQPTSLFVSSPISQGSAASYSSSSTSRPNSPSISNLSQLSVVRQRLAQIERNHSQLSAQSLRSGTPSTRSAGSSPVDREGSSGWERREAMFHNNSNACAKRAKSVVISTTPGSIRSKDERKRVAVPPKMKRPSQREEERRTGAAALTRRHMSSNYRRTNHGRIDDANRHVPAPPSPSATPKAQGGPSKETDIWKPLSRELVDIKAVLGGESGDATIHQMVSGLEHRMRAEHKTLRSIQGGLNELGEQVVEAVASASASASAKAAAMINAHGGSKTELLVLESNKGVMQVLGEVNARLSTELPVLVTKLEEIRKVQEKAKAKEILEKGKETEQPIVTLHNITKSSSLSGGDELKAIDLKPILDKLEEIRILCNVPPQQEMSSKEVDGAKEDSQLLTLEHLQKILNLVEEDSKKQTLLSQQQADSVRYLNELNNWLEAFVNNGTSQIQGISTSVDRLCSELGLSEDSSPNVPGYHPQQGPAPSRPNLIKDIQQLMQGIQARDQNFVALQGAVHSLLEILTVSQTRQVAESQAIAGVIDRQRHEQEALFRAFTNEISDEIKGERLRFVEAMKEATAINIQIHVEQFKQELGREVMAMTEEVGRLHREKQQVENQISDLFSFYSKHKQPEVPLQTNVGMPPPKQAHPQERERARANIPRSQHRLLPYPRHS